MRHEDGEAGRGQIHSSIYKPHATSLSLFQALGIIVNKTHKSLPSWNLNPGREK